MEDQQKLDTYTDLFWKAYDLNQENKVLRAENSMLRSAIAEATAEVREIKASLNPKQISFNEIISRAAEYLSNDK